MLNSSIIDFDSAFNSIFGSTSSTKLNSSEAKCSCCKRVFPKSVIKLKVCPDCQKEFDETIEQEREYHRVYGD